MGCDFGGGFAHVPRQSLRVKHLLRPGAAQPVVQGLVYGERDLTQLGILVGFAHDAVANCLTLYMCCHPLPQLEPPARSGGLDSTGRHQTVHQYWHRLGFVK